MGHCDKEIKMLCKRYCGYRLGHAGQTWQLVNELDRLPIQQSQESFKFAAKTT